MSLALMFLVILVLAVVDLAGDATASTSVGHLVMEAAVALVGLVGFVVTSRRGLQFVAESRRLVLQTQSLEADLVRSHAEAERWRGETKDLIAGLGDAIDRQLDQWGLSPAEMEIAMLLLKGLSHKGVAEVRGVSEATVRQQARAIYRKAGLTGRADLAAFFLEDLLAPRASTSMAHTVTNTP